MQANFDCSFTYPQCRAGLANIHLFDVSEQYNVTAKSWKTCDSRAQAAKTLVAVVPKNPGAKLRSPAEQVKIAIDHDDGFLDCVLCFCFIAEQGYEKKVNCTFARRIKSQKACLSSLNPPNAFGLEFRAGSDRHNPMNEQESMPVWLICPVNKDRARRKLRQSG